MAYILQLLKHKTAILWVVLALPVIYFISKYNYNLFHSFADGTSIVIAACAFTIIWNSRRLVDNNYFLFTGIAFLFFALLDLMHLLGNKNMGVFPEYGNLGPTFYIASRYILSISLLIAPFFINRRLNTTIMFIVYSLATLLILLSIFYWRIFPACIVEGVGLTPFKIISDYIICLILLGALGMLFVNRQSFDSRVLWIIASSLILFIATGLTFTLYTDPFGITNMVGHLLQIASFYLVYLAFIETSLTKPQEILFRKLKQNEEMLTENLQQLDYANVELNKEITERKLAEEKLRSTFQRLHTLVSNISSGILVVGKDGIVLANQAFCDYFELQDAPADLTGLTLNKMTERIQHSYLYPEEEVIRIQEILKEGQPIVGEEVAMRGGRTCLRDFIPISLNGISDGRLWQHIDITERKRAEDALRESEERLRFALETIHAGAWDLDPIDHSAFRSIEHDRIFGYSQLLPEWTYEMFLEHVLPEDRSMVDGKFRQALENKSDWNFECRINRVDGQVRWIWAVGRHTRDAAGVARRMSGIVQDISERKYANDALRESMAKLEAVNKELETFSYSVSHDLRAPLRAIDGYSRMILKKQKDRFDEDTKLKFQMIRNQVENMGRLIDDLLAFSRFGRQELSKVNINMDDLIRKVWGELVAINPGRTMSLKMQSIPELFGDLTLIRQVYSNLLGNAVKFTKTCEPAVIEVGSFMRDNEHVYYVKDNGIGFDMAYYDKLFGVFQRLHSDTEYEGTGIGLALVQRIVKRHEGYVWAEGEVNKGATFYFTLPSTRLK